MHQGGKVGSAATGEITRIKDNVIVNAFPDGVDLMIKLRNVVKNLNQTLLTEKL